jgi:aldehyde:ferredoxin oxidoreductase
MDGFGGTILRINLETGEITRQPTPEKFAKAWLGARGFISKILYDEVPRDADPLGPDNVFILAPGILTGTFAPAGSKIGMGCISPATNGYADSSMGGHFGPELKYAGYDMIVLEKQASSPQYLVIDDDKVELRSAEEYWGKGSLTLERTLKTKLGADFQIATIGPAAENGIVFSCVTHDFGRQAGRCGTGAVLGSKKIKAIAVRGTKSLAVNDLDTMTKATMKVMRRTRKHENMEPWQKFGTAFFVNWSNEKGCFPTRNFQTSYYEDADKISGQRLVDECLVSHKACFGCWIGCGKYSKATVAGKPETYQEGPEYETIALIGGACAMDNIHHVAYANHLCDELGVDTMSCGSVIAFAMECYEKGIITTDDLEGQELRWGNIEDFEHFLKMMVERRGIGDLFAKGTKAAAEALGNGSADFACQVKGMEVSGYDPRWYPGQLLSFCTSDIGAHHNRAWSITADIELGQTSIEGKADVVIYLQHIRPLFDTWSCCRLFWGEVDVTPEEHLAAIKQATGWDMSLEECLVISERIWNLNRAHYIERNGGPGRQFDGAPKRFLEEKVPDGPAKGHTVGTEKFQAMLDDYYRGRGWDSNGNPTRELLQALNIEYAADNLEKVGFLGSSPNGGIPAVRGKELKPKAM